MDQVFPGGLVRAKGMPTRLVHRELSDEPDHTMPGGGVGREMRLERCVCVCARARVCV